MVLIRLAGNANVYQAPKSSFLIAARAIEAHKIKLPKVIIASNIRKLWNYHQSYNCIDINNKIKNFKQFIKNPSLEVRGIFPVWPSDSVWHEDFLFKLKRLCRSRKYCGYNSFLLNRHQRVVLNGQSKLSPIKAGFPQGSISDPLFFLVYINDLTKGLLINPKIFADDTSVFTVVKDRFIFWINAM